MTPKSSCAAFATVIVLAAALGSAQAQDGKQNPSGSCGVRADGSRSGYHHALNAIWVPDCQNTLHREYWRVFVRNGGAASIIPRPDGAPELRPICTDPQHALRSIVDRYMLCTTAASNEHACIVNTVSVSDALQISHFSMGSSGFGLSLRARQQSSIHFPYRQMLSMLVTPAGVRSVPNWICVVGERGGRKGQRGFTRIAKLPKPWPRY
jgi:hypothetical protein